MGFKLTDNSKPTVRKKNRSMKYLSRSPKAKKTYPEGRICSKKGCDTILSMYNGSTRCSLHKY